MRLVGRWTKLPNDACAERYPAEIEFREATYLARKGPGQGFIIWDAGMWELAGPDQMRIGTATDELVEYRYTLENDDLTFVDSAGCTFRYRRVD